jgi:hypothetical protein
VAGLPARLKESPSFSAEEPYLAWAAGEIAAALGSVNSSIVKLSDVDPAASLHAPVPATMLPALNARKEWNWAEAVVPIRLGPGDTRLLLLGRRQGGRRYLGEDLAALDKTAAEIEECVESLRSQEMNRLVSQAELRALQSQINPHFLFNALNTLYGTIPREAAAARRIVLNLADIFRYFLQTGRSRPAERQAAPGNLLWRALAASAFHQSAEHPGRTIHPAHGCRAGGVVSCAVCRGRGFRLFASYGLPPFFCLSSSA